MADESTELPTSRVARWLIAAALILFAVGLYFRDGRHVAPLTVAPAEPAAPRSAP